MHLKVKDIQPIYIYIYIKKKVEQDTFCPMGIERIVESGLNLTGDWRRGVEN